MRLWLITSELEGHWKLESRMLMKVARTVWGGAVGNVPQGNALATDGTIASEAQADGGTAVWKIVSQSDEREKSTQGQEATCPCE